MTVQFNLRNVLGEDCGRGGGVEIEAVHSHVGGEKAQGRVQGVHHQGDEGKPAENKSFGKFFENDYSRLRCRVVGQSKRRKMN